ncbi:MAG: hypothetical protein RRC07_16965 [Anaerolineae bacterium]|nr:hypothetical protein [Anaerolineae bacterium]
MKRLAVLFPLVLVLAVASGCSATDLLRQVTGVDGNPPVVAQPAPAESQPLAVPTPTLAATTRSQERLPAPSPTAVPHDVDVPATPTAAAATATAPPAAQSGPLSGTFVGLLNGDGDSQAPLVLELEQQGRIVGGVASLGEGITINAGGFCGRFAVPASTFEAREELESADSRRLQTTTSVDVEGFVIPVDLTISLSPDGKTITAEATLETPALCANDPTLVGTLTRRGGGD